MFSESRRYRDDDAFERPRARSRRNWDDDEDPPRRKKKKKKKSAGVNGIILWVCGAFILLVIVGVAAGVVISRMTASAPRGGGEPAAKTKGGAADIPVWQTDADMLGKLGAEVRIDKYGVRPPADFVPCNDFVDRQGNPLPAPPRGAVRLGWRAQNPQGQAIPVVFVVTVYAPQPNEFIPPLDQFNDSALREMKKKTPANWTQSAAKRGKISGITFLCTSYSADFQGQKDHGFTYLGIDERTVILLEFDCLVGVDLDWAQKLAEAAALSFKKP